MTTGNDIYERLSEKIGVVGYPRYVEILKHQMTPEDAELAVDLADGKTRDELAKKMNIDEKTLHDKIEALLDDWAAEGLIPEHVPALVQGHLDEALSTFAEQGFPFGHDWSGPEAWDWFECCPCDEGE